MGEVIYRVNIRISYCEACFDFDDIKAAGDFAATAVTHAVADEDSDKVKYVGISVVKKGENDAEE